MTPKIIPFSHPFLIQASGASPQFLSLIQSLIDTLIPETLWASMPQETEPLFFRLKGLLPLFHSTLPNDSSRALLITYLCPLDLGIKAKRCVRETLSRYLMKEKPLESMGSLNLQIQFIQDPSSKYLIAQEIFPIYNEEEEIILAKNISEILLKLKENLSFEFLGSADKIVHPIFMPRNEEELIRNLISLSSQIKYVKDLPQATIHYEKQTDSELFFTVILARLLRGSFEPLRKLMEKSSLKIGIDDVRVMGYLKQKYPKEAAILHISVDKSSFFRPDRSVDLLKARQKIASQLTLCLGEFRDFNGGMILKQEEALGHLRKEVGPGNKNRQFLLEEYFYSLKPVIMQTVHDTQILKRHFELLCESLPFNPDKPDFKTYTDMIGKYFLFFAASSTASFKDPLLKALSTLGLSSRDLTTSFLEIDETVRMGFILKAESAEIILRFQDLVLKTLEETFTKESP